MKNFKLTHGTRSYLIQEIESMDLTEPRRVDIDEYRSKRGLSANALSWVWYNTIGTELGMTNDEVHADSKIQFGLPILFRSKSDYAYSVSRLLDGVKFYQLSSENQRRAINPIAVTSKFNTKEMSEYLESIQRFYGIQGINLESE
ncbi:hypothetical protein CL622_05595 [archaeon]|nr:hypothetical protein [archaeon]|tara:strand:- start:210 stop:644 length:435 start_codon:yes stop_codon:yes gene_type:complete